MNWKRIINVGVGVIGVVAISVLCTKACSDYRESEEINSVRETISDAQDAIKKVGERNKALQDSVAMWRDSVEFYKKGLEDCEKRKPVKKPEGRSEPVKPVVPSRPQPKPQPKPQPQPRDTVYIVCAGVKGGHETDIDLHENARNNNNIIVQNALPAGSNTKISLGDGATNNGNIVVNNGGSVKINDNRQAIDSLRVAIDTLTRQPKTAAASSFVLVRKVKTYQRTR